MRVAAVESFQSIGNDGRLKSGASFGLLEGEIMTATVFVL